MTYGGARAVWLLALFDLPVVTREQRSHASRFRERLRDDGFVMLQYSVYARPCPNEENARVHFERIRMALPPEGEVRVLTLTDMQFSRMKVFRGASVRQTEKPPVQLTLF
jgi:CRISPR-associated protein Cas2